MIRYETKVKILSASLAGLVLLLVLGAVFSPERRLARGESGRLLSGEAKAAARIEFTGPAGSLNLEKDDKGAWKLHEADGELPAASARIEGFLGQLAAVARLSPLAEGKAAWESLGLEEGKGTRVRVRDSAGKTVADFVAGSYGATGKVLAVRLGEAEKVYAADGAIGSYVGAGRASWLELRVLEAALSPEDVQGLAMRAKLFLDGAGRPGKVFDWRAGRDQGGWTAGAQALDSLAVETLIRGILNLEGEDAHAAIPAEAFGPVALRVEIALGTGQTLVYEVGAPAAEGRYFLRRAGGGPVFEVSAYALRNLAKSLPELAAKK
ncbi:MAG: DUF4340 domain-containing protein [Spirochaetaceae bacterium]|nr:DUF4340 domain-containing protein [Spirochaetaceae bacterium]